MKNLNFEELGFEFQTTPISLTKMAKREGTSRQTLSKYFKQLGIDVVNKQNRCKFNEHIFDEIDTEEKAYWLGFIFADGYIGSTPVREDKKSIYNFELSLQVSDSLHLKKFKQFISYEKEIIVDSFRCRIMFANKHFWTTLNNYGCTPKKSLTLEFPDISIFKDSSLIRHFIRGYFDGDGCFSRHINHASVIPNISLIGTKSFIDSILHYSQIDGITYHDKRHNENTISLRYNKNESIQFINYLYLNSTIYLDRKYKLFEFFKNGSRSVKEFTELLSGNIGENPEVDNTEINSEIKESESSYSIESETEKNIISPRVSDIQNG